MSNYLLSLISAITLISFQNCSNDITTTATLASENANAMDPAKLRVGPSVYPRSDSVITNPVPLSISQSALPLAIDFSPNPLYNAGSNSVSWGYWLSSWKQLPQGYIGYLGQPEFSYRLDLFKDAVVDLSSRTIVYQLSPAESQALQEILNNSILANAQQFAATATCTPSTATEYATLETDYGMFDLGAGEPCATVDLFSNNGSGQTAGLQAFLTQVQGHIPTVSP